MFVQVDAVLARQKKLGICLIADASYKNVQLRSLGSKDYIYVAKSM